MLALTLAACTSTGDGAGSLFPSSGAPPRSTQDAPYPALGAPPVQRDNPPMSAEDRRRIEGDLTKLLEQRQRMSGTQPAPAAAKGNAKASTKAASKPAVKPAVKPAAGNKSDD